jgi:hypothetical protein
MPRGGLPGFACCTVLIVSKGCSIALAQMVARPDAHPSRSPSISGRAAGRSAAAVRQVVARIKMSGDLFMDKVQEPPSGF